MSWNWLGLEYGDEVFDVGSRMTVVRDSATVRRRQRRFDVLCEEAKERNARRRSKAKRSAKGRERGEQEDEAPKRNAKPLRRQIPSVCVASNPRCELALHRRRCGPRTFISHGGHGRPRPCGPAGGAASRLRHQVSVPGTFRLLSSFPRARLLVILSSCNSGCAQFLKPLCAVRL